MPSFNARGITATLSIAPLQGTLSDAINLAETAQQEKRVKKAFDAGQKLRERPIGPIGPNGKTPGVVQYLGNTPFLMAEASERMRSGIPLEQRTTEDTSDLTAPDDSPDSQLLAESSDPAKQSGHPGISLDQDPQALMLTVATSTSSHIKSLAPQRAVVKTPDLKIEAFLNGALIGSEYINPRRANVAISTNKQTFFSGVRIHRQVEKPWVYRTAESLVNDAQTAQYRWETIGAALKEEALDRGADADGNGPPSATFLSVLSAVPLPEHVKDASHLAVIDVVVSTGSGKKYGSVAGFVLGPLRMESNKFKRAVIPSVEEVAALDRPRSSSPDVPLAQDTGEPPNKRAKHDSAQPSPPAMDSRLPSPLRNEITMQGSDRAEFAIELGAVPTGRLVKQIAPSLPATPSARRRPNNTTKNGKPHSPIKLKLSASRGTAKSWIKDPLPTSSDETTDAGQSSEPPDAATTQVDSKTSRSVKGDPYTDEEALNNFRPPQLCEGSAVTFAGAGQYRLIPRWRPGYFDEEEVVGGMRIVIT